MAVLYGRAGRLTAKNGGFRPGQGAAGRPRQQELLFRLVDSVSSITVDRTEPLARVTISTAEMENFFARFFVLADGTVDTILGAAEAFFGVAIPTHEKRGDGRRIRLPVTLPGADYQGRCDEQGLDHAHYYRPKRPAENLAKARKMVDNPQYKRASAETLALRIELQKQAAKLTRRRAAKLAAMVFDIADTDGSGEVGYDEWVAYIGAEPRLLDWLRAMGSVWLGLGKEIVVRQAAPPEIRKFGLDGLAVDVFAGPGVPTPTAEMANVLIPLLEASASLKRWARTLAEAPEFLSRAEWRRHAICAGLRHRAIADAFFDVWLKLPRALGAETSQSERDIELHGLRTRPAAAVDTMELVCGVAMLRLDASLPQIAAFTFRAIDADGSGAIEPRELDRFLAVFCRPALSKTDADLTAFYRLAGFEADFRAIVAKLCDTAFEGQRATFVADAFASDDNNDGELSWVEFKAWAAVNSNMGQWCAQLLYLVMFDSFRSIVWHRVHTLSMFVLAKLIHEISEDAVHAAELCDSDEVIAALSALTPSNLRARATALGGGDSPGRAGH